MMEKDGKTCFSVNNMISTSKLRAEHLFAGQNTQIISLVKSKVVMKQVNLFFNAPIHLYLQTFDLFSSQAEAFFPPSD